jgi:hypothetical protein
MPPNVYNIHWARWRRLSILDSSKNEIEAREVAIATTIANLWRKGKGERVFIDIDKLDTNGVEYHENMWSRLCG